MATRCERFAEILKGTKSPAPNGVCFVTRTRMNIKETVLGTNTNSPVVFTMAFSYEKLAANGTALCLGEYVFRQREVKAFLNAISNHGIRVTAVHNHWMLENPRLIYVHWEARMKPLDFATVSANALKKATGK